MRSDKMLKARARKLTIVSSCAYYVHISLMHFGALIMTEHVEDFQTFEDFWPYYLQEHSTAPNRRLHQIGTTAALSVLGYGILSRRKRLIAAAPIVGYGFAWVGHFILEKNRPATFKYPVYSLMGDLRLTKLMWRGELDAELERFNIGQEPVDMDAETVQESTED